MTQTLSDQLAVTLSESAAPETTFQKIFPYGVYKHPRHGTLDFRESFFDHIKQNFDGKTRGIDVQIDYDHEAGKSAGWVKSLDVRPGDGMYAEIAWTPSGRDAVKAGEWKYVSPEYGPHYDEKTGKVTPKVLAAVSLTNRPHLKVLPAVQLSEERGDPDEVDLSEIELIEDGAESVELGEVTNGQARESGMLAKGAGHTDECDDDCEVMHLAEPSAAQKVQAKTAKSKSGSKSPAAKKGEDDEEDPQDQPQQLPYRTEAAPPAAEGRRTGAASGKTKKPAGNEGALQPGQMVGPKPHIIRGRKPDPTNEAAHMSEQNENTPAETSDTVALAEQKEVAKRLSDKVTALESERTALSERLAAMELRERQRDIADDVRRLSEDRTVRLADEDVPAKYGVPTVVAQAYEAMALSEAGFSREGVFTLLSQLKKVGMVALTEEGTAHAGIENDPNVNTGVSLDEKIVNRAIKLAETAGKDFMSLDPSERELFAIRAERELKG